ncbi:MAG: hypothetical protein NTW87_00845 [Planctomycetota bacterium]|nr:hypothetical protein [Planctomycetota bacterium]
MPADGEKRRYNLLSSTDHPISGDTKISRYLTFEKFVWLIEKSALYHTRLDRLGDPFEGSVTRPYARKRDSGEIEGYMPLPQYEGVNNIRLMLCTFVSCWHASPVESAAMWKLYSREDAGVAVVSTPARMRDAVDVSSYRTAWIQPVEYLDFEKDDMTLPFAKRAMPGLVKRKSFEHEKEVRALIRIEEYPEDAKLIFSPEWVQGLAETMPPGISASVDLPRLIEGIHVSPLAGSWFVDLVRALVERHGLAGLVRKSGLLGDPVF